MPPRMNTPLVLAADVAVLADGPRLPRPTLKHCLLLATLLHLWLVALVGTAPGGPALPGEGVWSSIQVRLGGAGPADSPGRAETPLPNSGPPGRAPEPRFGGTVRDAPPRPSPEPGAAELGTWAPQPLPGPAGSLPSPPVAAPEPAPTAAPPPVLTRPAPQRALQPLERRDEAPTPPSAPPSLPDPPARPAPAAAPSTAPRLAPVDTLEAPALDRPEQLQRDIATPAPTPLPALRPQAAPAPSARPPRRRRRPARHPPRRARCPCPCP